VNKPQGSNEPLIDNDIEKYTARPQKSTAEIDAIADQLVEAFANPGARLWVPETVHTPLTCCFAASHRPA
jgi:hypothetical protein